MVAVPAAAQPARRGPDGSIPLYGVRYVVAAGDRRLTNSEFFIDLLGDSSAVVHYLRRSATGLPRLEQTGSNFGAELKHDAAVADQGRAAEPWSRTDCRS